MYHMCIKTFEQHEPELYRPRRDFRGPTCNLQRAPRNSAAHVFISGIFVGSDFVWYEIPYASVDHYKTTHPVIRDIELPHTGSFRGENRCHSCCFIFRFVSAYKRRLQNPQTSQYARSKVSHTVTTHEPGGKIRSRTADLFFLVLFFSIYGDCKNIRRLQKYKATAKSKQHTRTRSTYVLPHARNWCPRQNCSMPLPSPRIFPLTLPTRGQSPRDRDGDRDRGGDGDTTTVDR